MNNCGGYHDGRERLFVRGNGTQRRADPVRKALHRWRVGRAGRWRHAGEHRSVHGQALGARRLSAARRTSIEAVAAAREAFGPWSRMPGHERAALMRRFADLYASERLSLRCSRRVITAARCASRAPTSAGMPTRYHWCASLADKNSGRTIPIDDSVHAFTTRVPVGVVGAITPWNVPLMAALWKLGPALAAGCTVVLKPAEQTPVTSLELGKLFEQAGFPPGVVNIVPGYGKGGAGEHLVAHPDVNKIAFTGEGSTAQAILRAGARHAQTLHVRARWQGAAHHLRRRRFRSGAQCRDRFGVGAVRPKLCTRLARPGRAIRSTTGSVDEFATRAQRVRVGLPLLEDDAHGPAGACRAARQDAVLYRHRQGRRAPSWWPAAGALSDGALAGGYFIEPTVFANVDNDMRIAREEIFGPVAALIPFDGEEEAIALANDTTYGSTAGLWTRDVGRALRVSSRIEAGMVWVNTYRYIRWSTPYGGFKASGWGRENGLEGTRCLSGHAHDDDQHDRAVSRRLRAVDQPIRRGSDHATCGQTRGHHGRGIGNGPRRRRAVPARRRARRGGRHQRRTRLPTLAAR